MDNNVDRAEALLRSQGPAKVPPGLAERAARLAIRAGKRPRPLFDQYFGVAWRTAAAAVAIALLLAVFSGTTAADAPISQDYDPLAGTTELPYSVSDPTYAALGGLR